MYINSANSIIIEKFAGSLVLNSRQRERERERVEKRKREKERESSENF